MCSCDCSRPPLVSRSRRIRRTSMVRGVSCTSCWSTTAGLTFALGDYRRSLNCIRWRVHEHLPGVSPQRRVQLQQHRARPDRLDPIAKRWTAATYSLPFACSLCGSCSDVCPVKIDLHSQLLTWRGRDAKRNQLPLQKKLTMKVAATVLGRSWLYRLSGWLARKVVPWLRFLVYNRFNP